MGWLRIVVAAMALSATSYAWAAPPEALVGRPMARDGFLPAAGVVKGPASAPSPGAARRYGRALAAIAPDAEAVTRGAKESRIYQTIAPSVVLIVSDEALGSGALIGADGTIITNLHVVGDSDTVGVVFKPKVEGAAIGKADVRRAKVIRRDEVADLALVRVDKVPAGVTPMTLAGATAVEVGADVHAIGHPTGEAWTYTRGIVSQIRRDYEWSAEDKIPHRATVIQTQTPINPGNSGGPLIDDAGELVGINSFSGEGEGLNFAVSADDVKALVARPKDRLVSRPKKMAGGKACKLKALKQRREKDPDGLDYLMDADCDGQGDFYLFVPDDRDEATSASFDDDGDGKIDTIFYDEDRDGYSDFAVYDTDGDGEPDMTGKFRDHEDEPYLFEKIKPKR